jgi:hypothetical protein
MSKQTAVEWLRHQLIENMVCRDPAKGISIMYFHDNAFLDLCGQAKQMEMEQMKEYADYAIKQLHETGICFYDEYGNLEDEKGGEE